MKDIPKACPQCGNRKGWQEEIDPFTSGVPTAAFGRVFFGQRGILLWPIRKLFGLNEVTYCCKSCGFRKKYPLKIEYL